MAATVVIGGAVVNISDVVQALSAIPKALQMIADGKGAQEIEKAILPLIAAVSEEVAAALLPGGGLAVGLVLWVISNARPMTFDEEQAWMARASDNAAEY